MELIEFNNLKNWVVQEENYEKSQQELSQRLAEKRQKLARLKHRVEDMLQDVSKEEKANYYTLAASVAEMEDTLKATSTNLLKLKSQIQEKQKGFHPVQKLTTKSKRGDRAQVVFHVEVDGVTRSFTRHLRYDKGVWWGRHPITNKLVQFVI